MARLEGAYEQVSQRLMNIDPRFDGVDRKIDLRFDALDKKIDQFRDALDSKFDQRFNSVDQRFNALEAKSDQRFMWMAGIVVTAWVTTIASIYFHH